MNSVTISNSGTAWLRDMEAQGKNPLGGWANDPNAARYASLDRSNAPPPSAQALPSSLEDLIKMQHEAAKEGQEEDLTEQLRQQLAKVASDGIPATGNIIDIKA